MLRDCHTHNLNSDDGIISIEPDFKDILSSKHYSCGLHPWKTNYYNDKNINELYKKIIENKNICALGEAGLDNLKGAPLDIQTKIFLKEIELSESLELPLIIHCVKSGSELLRIKKYVSPKCPWILHGFRGGFLQTKQFIDKGFYISIGEKFNREGIKAIPNEKLLLETDESSLSIEEIGERISKNTLEISTYNLNNILNKNY